MTDPARLIDAYLDGKLSKEAMDQLERDLVSNPKYADHFAKAMMVDALLKDRYERESIAASMQLTDGSFIGEDGLSLLIDDYNHAEAELVHVDGKAKRVVPKALKTQETIAWGPALRYAFGHGTSRVIRSKASVVMALSAVLLLALWLVNPFGDSEQEGDPLVIDTPDPVTPESNQAVVATLTAERDAVWKQPGGDVRPGALRPGTPLSAGQRLTLTQGFAEITTNRGAVAILEAPATIELTDNDNALQLHSGKLVGQCYTDSSKGFTVQTEYANVTDLGTAFGVGVSETNFVATVFTGEVEFTTNSQPTRRLNASQTARLTINDDEAKLILEDKVAQGFAGIHEWTASRMTQLPGTGYGLAKHEIDPNWQIVAIQGQPIDTPIVLHVAGDASFNAVPEGSLALHGSNPISPKNLPRERHTLDTVYRVQTTLEIPETAGSERTRLIAHFRILDRLDAIRVNGEAVELPVLGRARQWRHWHTVDMTPHIRAGNNTIEFDVVNQKGNPKVANPLAIEVAWELGHAVELIESRP